MPDPELGVGATGATKTGDIAFFFTNEETEVPRDNMTCPRPQNCQVAGVSDSKPWNSSILQFCSLD